MAVPQESKRKGTNGTDAQAEAEFADFYLQKVTAEFSDDLDKLRSAPDFKESSIEVIVQALQQGQSCFEKEDRIRIGRARLEREVNGK
ncbi:hypothetical protein ANO11243_028770 [Dothideomycetidae sp. 11243]|nr:hypothetical protein ANO11243_028770 [fungal sp. No.11243]